MKIKYTIGVLVSTEGTVAVNNPKVDSIDKLKEQYCMLSKQYNNAELYLFRYIDRQRQGGISFSELEKIARFMIK